MNNLTVDIGYKSINHYGEQLCGDHVDIVTQESDGSTIIVLADGLKSGVKASILSTLTSKIISTMMARGMKLEDCVWTIAQTLPKSSEYGVAYSTFTIIHVREDENIDMIQYENPWVLLLRDGRSVDYEKKAIRIEDKTVYKSEFKIFDGDLLVAMSDGAPGANSEIKFNKNWDLPQISEFVATLASAGYSAKTLAGMLVEKCYRLYAGKPADDTTACLIRVMKRAQVNLLFGPPKNKADNNRMMRLFFSKTGKHVICGGTTSRIAAEYLGKELRVSTRYKAAGGPPMSEIEGVDLVTEGIVTMDRVVKYVKDFAGENRRYDEWSTSHDPASLITRMIIEEATDVDFFVGQAVNPAHQGMADFNFGVKMQLVKDLVECLRKIGKTVRIGYF